MRFALKAVFRFIAVLALVAFMGMPSSAQVVFGGIFRQSNENRAAWIGDEWPGFLKKWQDLEKQGYRIFKFKTYMDGGQRRYAGLFKPGTYMPAAYVGKPWNDFLAQWQKFEKENYRIIDFETWTDGGERLYAGIFAPGTYKPAAFIGKPWGEFLKQWQQFEKEGYRIIDFETYVDSGQRLYAGIFAPGTYTPAAYIGKPWNDFLAQWQKFEKDGYRIKIFRTYVDNGERLYAGIFEPGNDAHGAWIGREYENFLGQWHQFEKEGLRLEDLQIYETDCAAKCMNQVVMPPICPAEGTPCNPYIYLIAGTSEHCATAPGTCQGNTQRVGYSWPVDVDNNTRYLHMGAMEIKDQFLTLPFINQGQNWSKNGWRYDNKDWHHAIDFSVSPKNSFEVTPAAAGTVIFIGWDWWSGNTIIISHDVGGVKDSYRTIYMHLRNGAETDCDNAWNVTIPTFISSDSKDPNFAAYTSYLNASGCTKDKSKRHLNPANWGTNEKLDTSLLGKVVHPGQVIAHSGQTGPGGGRDPSGGVNTHVHVFFTRRDPANGTFYFFDPYGEYSTPDCYPSGITDAPSNSCQRYPVVWKGGKPQFP